MPNTTRAILAAGALLASGALAQAGDQATFSPELKDPAVAAAAPAPAAAASAAEVADPARGRHGRRRTRLARARERRIARAAAELSRSVDPAAGIRHLTIGSIPAPMPPGRDDVSQAVATLETPPPSGPTEGATPGPGEAAAMRGAREEASHSLAELLAKHAFEEGVPVQLARAVVKIESGGNARASNHGALGLMQIKWATARAVGFSGSAAGLLVADTNLRYGMKVLAQAYHDAHGDLCGALMRYQSGHLARHASAANRAYCARARSLMARG